MSAQALGLTHGCRTMLAWACSFSTGPISLTVTAACIAGKAGAGPATRHNTALFCQHTTQDADAATRSALVEFSFQLAQGRLEEAFRAVAGVTSTAVWRGMAHMAIKSKRLDVAGA